MLAILRSGLSAAEHWQDGTLLSVPAAMSDLADSQ